MLPEKISRPHSKQENALPSNDGQRTHTLAIFENGKVVGRFIYDRLSSALSLVNELKILTQLKFNQLEISELLDLKPSVSSSPKKHRQGMAVNDHIAEVDHICKVLQQSIESSKQNLMPCSLVLMSVSFDTGDISQLDLALMRVSSIIGELKQPEHLFFWFPLDFSDSDCIEHTRLGETFAHTAFCLILPDSGLIKARFLLDEIKKQCAAKLSSYFQTMACGIGVNTIENSSDDLYSQVINYLKQSMMNDSKVFCSTDIVHSSQVSVEERTQLFLISKSTLR